MYVDKSTYSSHGTRKQSNFHRRGGPLGDFCLHWNHLGHEPQDKERGIAGQLEAITSPPQCSLHVVPASA